MNTDSATELSAIINRFCDSRTPTDPVTQRWLDDLRNCAAQLQSGESDEAVLTWGVINRSLSDCVPWTDDLLGDFYSLIRDIRRLRDTHRDIPTAFTR